MKQNKQTKRQKRTRAILIISIIIAFALLAVIVVMGLVKQEEPAPAQQELPEETIYGDEYLGIDPQVDEDLQDYRNVLLFGIDEASVSDLLMVTFNKATDEMKMTSIDGRTYLKIDEDRSGKISTACDAQDMDGLIRSLNQNLDLNIREGVALPWSMIEELVDEIGGIEMESADGQKQDFDGQQAVAYARGEGDAAEDSDRMQKVMMAALKKAKTLQAEEATEILDQVMPQVMQRSMSRDQVSALLLDMSVMGSSADISWPYESSESSQGGETVVIPESLTSNVSRLHAELFQQPNYQPIEAQ